MPPPTFRRTRPPSRMRSARSWYVSHELRRSDHAGDHRPRADVSRARNGCHDAQDVNRAHHLDVGGTVPGSFYAGATENYQEGLRIPPVKLMKRGKLDQEIMRFVTANVRLPVQMRADLQSQVSANLTAHTRVVELHQRYGTQVIRDAMEMVMDHSERRIREIIATWPDGEYAGEDAMDNDAITDEPRTVRVTIRVQGDGLEVDFTGSSPQAQGPLNSVLGYTASGVYMTIQAATDPT